MRNGPLTRTCRNQSSLFRRGHFSGRLFCLFHGIPLDATSRTLRIGISTRRPILTERINFSEM